MKRSLLIVGIVLLLIGVVLFIGDFKTYKRSTWSDIFPNVAAVIYLDRQPTFAYITLSDAARGNTLKVTVSPKESEDIILVLLMSPSAFSKFQRESVSRSDAFVWQEPTTLGQPVTFDFLIPETGTYVLVLRAWKDNNRNGVPFNLELELSTPLNLSLPGIGLAFVGIAVLVLGAIKKRKQVQPTSPPSAAAVPSPAPASAPFCMNCGKQMTYVQQYQKFYCPSCQKYA